MVHIIIIPILFLLSLLLREVTVHHRPAALAPLPELYWATTVFSFCPQWLHQTHTSKRTAPSTHSHDRILVDLRSGGEDVPADLGQADGGHHTHQQPLCQQQVQHPRSQGQTQHSIEQNIPLSSSLLEFFCSYLCVFCLLTGGNAGCPGGSVRWTGQTRHFCGKVNFCVLQPSWKRS